MAIPNFDNGARDLQTVSDVSNSQEDTTMTRMGDVIPTLAGSLRKMAVSAGMPFDTEADLLATPIPDPPYIAEVMHDPDPEKNGRYSPVTGVWVKSPDSTGIQIAEIITKKELSPQIVPLNHDADFKVAVWLANGDLDSRGVTPEFKQKVVRDFITQVQPGSIVPLVHDYAGRIAVWLEGGKLNAYGLADGLIKSIVGQSMPIATDGRSLFKLRSRSATDQIKIGFTGDSWSEYLAIPEAMRDLLAIDRTRSGEGWQSIAIGFKMNGVTLARSGTWSFVDGGTEDVSAHPTGIDGQSMYTISGTATVTVSNIKCTKFNIYHHSSNGAFRYRVDGGAWTNVTSTSGFGAVKLTGLADAIHTFEVDTTGNTGTLYILGFYATSDAPGFEIAKMGNAAQRGNTMRSWIPNISPIASDINLDSLIVILGTNDYRTAGATVEEYIGALSELVAQYKAATPDIGFVFVIPAQSDGVAVTPLSEYRDALYKFCVDGGHEFYNMYDTFGTYAQSNALGQWVDTLHLNQKGATNLVTAINSKILSI